MDFSPTNAYDYNKDFVIDATDQIIARNNGGFLSALVINPPPPAPAALGDGGSAIASALAIPADTSSELSAAGGLIDGAATVKSAAAPLPESPLVQDASKASGRDAGATAAVDLALDEQLLDELLDALVG